MRGITRLIAAAAAVAAAQGAAAPAPPPPPAAAAAAAPLTVEDLAELPFIADPLLSPDGKHIAARVASNGIERLAVYALPAGADAEPKLIDVGGVYPRWFAWAGPDRLLVGYMTVHMIAGNGIFAILPASRLKRYELSSGKTIDIGSGKGLLGDDVIFTDPWGRFILLSAQADANDTPSVERVDLETGAAVEVQRKTKDIWNWFADSAGHVRAGISYEGKPGYTIWYRTEPGGELRRAPTGQMPAGESVVDNLRLLPGSNSGIILTDARTGRFAAYRYDLGSAGLGAPIFEHPEADVESVILSADQSRVEGVTWEDERPRTKWLVPEMERLQAQMDRALPGKTNRILNRSADGRLMLVWSGSADDPGTYYVFDRESRRMTIFASPYNALVGRSFAPVKPVRYTARDGLSIPGYLTLPPGREAKGLPLVVMPHGGPFMRDGYRFDPWVQFLASRGYAVLQPNFRGSTGMGRAFVEKGYGQWGAGMQDDLDDGVAWLAAQGIVDRGRVCMMGASYGGYAALWATIRNPDIYRCAISFAGVTDVKAMLKYDSRMIIAPRYSRLWRLKVEGEEKRNLAAISPLQQARRIARPVLIAHGADDTNVPPDQGRKLIAALEKRGAAVEGVIYPDTGHGFERSEHSRDFLKRVAAFLAKHNPAS